MDFWQASSDVFKYLTTPEKIRGAMELTTTNIVPTNFVPPHSAKKFKKNQCCQFYTAQCGNQAITLI